MSGEWGTDDESGTGIPVLRTTNFTNEGIVNYNNVVTRTITKKNIQDKYLRKGDIIIEKSGGSDSQPVGRVIYYDGPEERYLFNNFTGLLRVQNLEIWNPKYVFYSLFANYKRGGTRAFENKTTGLHNLKIDDFVRRTDIPEIELSTQNNICEILDSAYQIIVNRRKQLDQLDTLIKARFVEMFGDEKNRVRLNDICSIITDGTHQPPKFVNEGIPFIFVSNITGDEVTYNAEKFISEETYNELITRTPIEQGDIIVSTVGSYGHVAVVKSDKKFLFQRHIAYLKPLHEQVDSEYLQSALLNDDAQRQIEAEVKGIAQKTLNLSAIKKIEIPVPNMARQNEFVSFKRQVDQSKAAVQKSLDETQLLMDSLMQQYFG